MPLPPNFTLIALTAKDGLQEWTQEWAPGINTRPKLDFPNDDHIGRQHA